MKRHLFPAVTVLCFISLIACDGSGGGDTAQSDSSGVAVNKEWTHPSDLSDSISPDGQDALSPQVAMDSRGNALVVWRQSNGSNSQIFKSEYR